MKTMKANGRGFNEKSLKALAFGGRNTLSKSIDFLFQGIMEPEYEPEPVYINSTYYYVA